MTTNTNTSVDILSILAGEIAAPAIPAGPSIVPPKAPAQPTPPAELTDADERFSLIEFGDAPRSPARPANFEREVMGAPVPVAPATRPAQLTSLPCECPIGTRPAAVNGMCPTCTRTRGARRPAPAASAPVTDSNPLGIQQLANAGEPAIIARQRDEIATLRTKVAQLEAQTTLAKSVVAGAKAEGSGVFLGFAGLNPVTRAQLAATLADAGAPAEWLPAAKSAHAQAGRVVGELNRLGYVARAIRAAKGSGRKNLATGQVARDWKAAWSVGHAHGSAQVGAQFGTVVLTVKISASDELRVFGDEGLAARVRAEFDAAVAGEVYGASDVTAWLQGILVRYFRAARVGGCWYVRAKYAVAAERLCTSLAKIWGRDWLLPAIPMSTCDQLRAGLVKSFTEEAERVLATYATELAAAKVEGKSEIGSKRAATLHSEIKSLAERAVEFSALFDSVSMATLRAKLSKAANEIGQSVDGITQRFELIFDELARDAHKSS